jgi:hypothetical protein
MEIKYEDLIVSFILGALFIFCVFGAMGKIDFLQPFLNAVKVEGCDGLGLIDTADCLNDEVNKIFKYNISNKGKSLTDTELIEMGGVCHHYAKIYKEEGERLGFKTQYVKFALQGEGGHIFTLLINEEGYCILDQTEKFCIELMPE